MQHKGIPLLDTGGLKGRVQAPSVCAEASFLAGGQALVGEPCLSGKRQVPHVAVDRKDARPEPATELPQSRSAPECNGPAPRRAVDEAEGREGVERVAGVDGGEAGRRPANRDAVLQALDAVGAWVGWGGGK